MARTQLIGWLFILCLSTPALAQRLPRTATPDHYDLAFAVDLARRSFEGTETIRVQLPRSAARIVLNAADIDFRSVTIEAGSSMQTARVSLDMTAETATLSVPKPLPAGPAEIHIRYAGTLNDQLRGFYLSRGDLRDYAVTQFESSDARRAFPSFDEPEYKATFALSLTIDQGDTAISNGRVVSDTPGPGAGRHTLAFATSPRMSSYLVAMAVGDFQCLEAATDNVPIRVCSTPDKKALGRIALESAQEILKFYNGYYSIPYPFGKLDMLAIPDFAAGAMENTAAIFYRETDLLADVATASVATRKNIASVVAHEMAHQWFGNLVTMQWWDDIWLNESFATWMANLPLKAWKPEWNVAVDEALENQKALTLDSLRATRPIHSAVQTPTEIDAAFDAIVYEKGAAVLRMVERYVGADTFRRGVNEYLRAHAYGNATSKDFWSIIASTSGKPVDAVLPSFINQPGVPLLDVTTLTCNGGRPGPTATLGQGRFSLDERSTGASTRTRWQIPVCFKTSDQTTPSCTLVSRAEQSLGLNTCPAWIFANAGGQGYYRTAYSPALVRAIAPHLDVLTAPERLTLVDDEWALVRARRHSAADYLALAANYGQESSSGVLGEVAGHLSFIHQQLTTDTTRTPFEAFARSLLRPLFDRLGFQPAASDDDDRRALRAVVIEALGTTGNDAEIIRQARATLDRALAGGPPLDPTLAASIVQIAAEHGDAALYDAFLAAGLAAGSPDERHLYFYAAADFRDPVIIDRALQRVLSPDLRTQDTALFLAEFFASPAARPRAWSFVTSQWTALEPKLTIFNADVTLTTALGSFCDAGSRDRIKAFFAAHPLPGAARSLDQSIERINGCIELREQQTKAVAEWLSARGQG